MSAIAEQQILIDEWRGLYRESWKGVIVDEAFAHPAKFSRALIQKIYEHVIEEGWANKGDSVVDPFGGVALGAFPAMQHGLVWYGCELEEKFVTLGNQNIALWNERYSRMPNWGEAHLLQGDSRKLVEVLSAADCCVSSPPYAGNEKSDYLMSDDGKTRRRDEKRGFKQGHGCFRGSEGAYGQSEGQLGGMREGDHSLVVSSPPYVHALGNAKNYADPEKAANDAGRDIMRANAGASPDKRYGVTGGNLGAMPEGQLCVTSPPFESSTQVNNTPGDITEGRARWEGGKDRAARVKQDYADYASEGNLGNLRGGFDAAISSPPYEGSISDSREGDSHRARKAERFANGEFECTRPDIFSSAKNIGAQGMWCGKYSMDPENVGNQRGETFWSASRLILEQLHQVIIPGGHAVFVVKAFVRDKKIVDFPAQWAQLCEAVGFRLLHDHHALLTEHYGTQGGFDEDKKLSVERKSFFRRLAESKGSPKIDYEQVLCFERD